MNDFASKRNEEFASHFDIVRRIETMSGEIPYAIKQFKSQVLDFRSMDKKLSAMKSKTEKRANTKNLDKLDAFINEYQAAYKKCSQSYASIVRALDEIDSLYTKLSDYYLAEGKRRESKRALADGERFDKLSRKQLSQVYDRLEASAEIAVAKENTPASAKEELDEKPRSTPNAEAPRGRREEPSRMNRGANPYGNSAYQGGAPYQPPYPPYTHGAPYYPPQYMPPHYAQPMAGLSIAPIAIDVNSAVDSLLDSVKKAFDEKIGDYAQDFRLPEAKASSVTLGESEALNKVIEDESYVLEKLSGLFEKINGIFTVLSELTAKYSELEEKTQALTESMKSASDTQRTLSRELQGIQATQKVIGVDQLKLAEEQAVIVEAQALAISRQSELRDAESAVSNEISALLDGANATADSFKASLAAQNEITNALGEVMAANEKLLELQKNLEERQAELSELQREAILAQKKITRSQKAVNERLGAKTSVKKEKTDSEKAELPEAELNESEELKPEIEATEKEELNPEAEAIEAQEINSEAEAPEIQEVKSEEENGEGEDGETQESSPEASTTDAEASEEPLNEEALSL